MTCPMTSSGLDVTRMILRLPCCNAVVHVLPAAEIFLWYPLIRQFCLGPVQEDSLPIPQEYHAENCTLKTQVVMPMGGWSKCKSGPLLLTTELGAQLVYHGTISRFRPPSSTFAVNRNVTVRSTRRRGRTDSTSRDLSTVETSAGPAICTDLSEPPPRTQRQ